MEALADGFVLGNPTARLAFVRAGGDSANFFVVVDHELLLWMGGMLKRIYTPALTFQRSEAVMLPLNPFKFLQNQLNAAAAAWLEGMVPERDVMSAVFSSTFQLGAVIIPSSLLQESVEHMSEVIDTDWEMAARSPGLKAISRFVSEDAELQSVPLSDQDTAL